MLPTTIIHDSAPHNVKASINAQVRAEGEPFGCFMAGQRVFMGPQIVLGLNKIFWCLM